VQLVTLAVILAGCGLAGLVLWRLWAEVLGRLWAT
jgi:Flp pilus assembly protein CpaB